MIDHWLALPALGRLVVSGYLLVMAFLAIQGLHRYTLVLGARRRDKPRTPPALPSELPIVTVQLPIFNERFVARRLIRAVAALDWPRERLDIQVLDDSTDDTVELVAAEVAHLREAGITIEHVRRTDRSGFKAGALAAGLERIRGDLVAIFDADFVPEPSLLRQVVGEFEAPRVGMVQVRWGHLNRLDSLLTRIQALALDGHFLVDQRARARAGRFFNFNGTAGIWRRQAIDDAGGWQSDTLTEDLDLSYRAQLAGWRFVYRDDLVAPAELPADINAYKGQQHRWAKGSAQSAVKLLPALWLARLPFRTKVEATFHLTGNFAYPLLLALALLLYPALELRYRSGWTQTLWLDLPFFMLGTLSVVAFFQNPLQRDGTEERDGHKPSWWLLPPLMALGVGMTVNNGRAVLAGLVGHQSEFKRTPKVGDQTSTRRPYSVNAQLWVAAELLLGVHFLFMIQRAWQQGLYLSLPFLCLFAAGFLGVALSSIRATMVDTESKPATIADPVP